MTQIPKYFTRDVSPRPEPPPPAPQDHPGPLTRDPAARLRVQLSLGWATGLLHAEQLADRAWDLAGPALGDDAIRAVLRSVLTPGRRTLSPAARRLLATFAQVPELVTAHDLALTPWDEGLVDAIADLDRPASAEGLVYTTFRDLTAAASGDGLWLHAHAPFGPRPDRVRSDALADRLLSLLDAAELPTYRHPVAPMVLVPIRWRG